MNPTWSVDPQLDRPPSRQLADQILDAVASDAFGPGSKLPSVRDLAALVLINPNTVSRAYRDLEAMGVVKGRSGSGVFVTEKGPALAAAARGEETLRLFEEAARAALRAGHAMETLAERLKSLRARKRDREATR
ncbi:MAG: GntR family transcriptional regulator [Planctomycetota bacterium]